VTDTWRFIVVVALLVAFGMLLPFAADAAVFALAPLPA
jgi:hypothetical protein